MEVLNMACLDRFMRKHPDARTPIQHWLKAAQAADWQTFQDVRRSFAAVDGGVITQRGKVEVFNVHGNNYRLIAKIIYPKRRIVIMDILTHAEYSRNTWKQRM